MKPPAQIKEWLNEEELIEWLKSAQSSKSYKRRLAIKLTAIHRMHANDIAEILEVSVSSIWSWVSRYNLKGPKDFDFKPRGGRRHEIFTKDKEKQLVQNFKKDFKKGKYKSINEWALKLEDISNQDLSPAYAYNLLKRYGISAKTLKG